MSEKHEDCKHDSQWPDVSFDMHRLRIKVNCGSCGKPIAEQTMTPYELAILDRLKSINCTLKGYSD
jgi:hypothetical protein